MTSRPSKSRAQRLKGRSCHSTSSFSVKNANHTISQSRRRRLLHSMMSSFQSSRLLRRARDLLPLKSERTLTISNVSTLSDSTISEIRRSMRSLARSDLIMWVTYINRYSCIAIVEFKLSFSNYIIIKTLFHSIKLIIPKKFSLNFSFVYYWNH